MRYPFSLSAMIPFSPFVDSDLFILTRRGPLAQERRRC